MHLHTPPQWLRLISVLRWWFCRCWFIVYCWYHCLWGLCVWFLYCYAVRSVISSFAIILMGKTELIALLFCLSEILRLLLFCGSSSWYRGLVCIVVFPNNTHFLTNNQFMDAQCIPRLLDIDLVIALLKYICIQVICDPVEINLSWLHYLCTKFDQTVCYDASPAATWLVLICGVHYSKVCLCKGANGI